MPSADAFPDDAADEESRGQGRILFFAYLMIKNQKNPAHLSLIILVET
jgi:hypothetical protein